MIHTSYDKTWVFDWSECAQGPIYNFIIDTKQLD